MCINSNSSTNEQAIEVENMNTFQILLEEIATAGYEWITEFDSHFIKLDKEDFKAGDAIGASGKHMFQFRALNRGYTEIKMTYKRPWEKRYLQIRIYKVTIK